MNTDTFIVETAYSIAKDVMADLHSRSGILDDVDDETLADIQTSICRIATYTIGRNL